MKNILFLLLFIATMSKAQAPLIPAYKIEITSVTTFADPYTVVGKTLDFTSNWDASDIQVGDSLFMADGNELRVYSVASIVSAASTDFTITIDDFYDSGQIPNAQEGAMFRTTENWGFTSYVAGISEALQTMIDDRFVQRLDQIIVAEILIGTAPPVGTPEATDKFFYDSTNNVMYFNVGDVWVEGGFKIYGDFTDEDAATSGGVPSGGVFRASYNSIRHTKGTLIKVD